jgi:hypothetical protein
MNYNDIKDMTNEEAVSYFSVITNRHIPCGELENLLGWSGKAKRNAVTGSWEGSLIDFMESGVVPPLSEGLGELFSHLNKPRSVGCDTDSQPWASKMADLLEGLEMVGQADAMFTSQVAELGMGYAYPGLDVDAVQAVRDEEAQRVADEQAAEQAASANAAMFARQMEYGSRYNEYLSPVLSNPASTDADMKLALETLAATYGA